jgi:PAS domain S-box-containing protein
MPEINDENKNKAIEELIKTHELLNDFFNHNPVLSFIKDDQGRYLYVSDSFLKFFSVEKHQVIGKTDFDWLPANIAKEFTDNDNKVRSTRGIIETIENASTKEGSIRSLVKKFPILSSSGKCYVGGVAVDIEARLKAEEELTATTANLALARDQALDASKLKSAFVANISHELRTPLSGILGVIELLLESGLNEDQKTLAETVQSSAQALLAIVTDILDLSKIEAGKLILENVPFNVLFLVQDCARLMAETAKNKSIVFRTSIDQNIPEFVIGDPDRIRQTLLNLISNSIKFTKQGEIVVDVSTQANQNDVVTICFTVKDTGIGIAKDEQRFLFMPFTQLDSSTTRKYSGTGLGLSICKHLVEIMGGEIGVESEEAQGASFWFKIPFKKFGAAATVSYREQIGASTLISSNKRILVVEDDPVLRSLTVRQLNHLGLQAEAVTSGKEAIEIVMKDSRFDIILMDCQLPDIDGFAATQTIREFEKNSKIKHIPIIAITALAMKGDREKCLEAGMDDYLSKPISIQQMSEKISKWISVSNI